MSYLKQFASSCKLALTLDRDSMWHQSQQFSLTTLVQNIKFKILQLGDSAPKVSVKVDSSLD